MISGDRKLFQRLRSILQFGHGLLAPPQIICDRCGNKSTVFGKQMRKLCLPCENQIPWIREIACSVCGRYEQCSDCRRRKSTHFEFSRSAVRYDEAMKQWLATYKYRGHERLETIFVEMLSRTYVQHFSNQRISHISYVPVSHERLLERGFNQAGRLAMGLGATYNLPVIPLLLRTRHTDKQSYKTRSERLSDMSDAFELNPETAMRLNAMSSEQPLEIIVIDDVYTTGSTLNQCAKVIRDQMPAKVYGLTWAR